MAAIYYDDTPYGGGASGESIVYLTQAEYDQITPVPGQLYGITDKNYSTLLIRDSIISAGSTWSSNKISTELSNKASATDLGHTTDVTSYIVSTSGWTEDTTSQTGTTLYKKSISITHVYVDSPRVTIGAASGSTLPTADEQTAFGLLKYVTVDDTVPCLYLYASAEPQTAFYINVVGVD